LAPVDPIALNIPTYFDVVAREDARDLGLIRSNLESGKYESVELLQAETQLMVDNAVRFNGAESDVGRAALALMAKFNEIIGATQSKNLKRKDTDDGASGSPKKPKLG
jgi:transcription initiation factor TFIID subunit 2